MTIATIHFHGTATISGIQALVSMDENNNCKVMVENFTPYDVTIMSPHGTHGEQRR
jgi:hypothetical protein